MKTILIGLAITIILLAIVALLYMRHVAKNSPSIIGGGYDEKMKAAEEVVNLEDE